MKRCGFYLFTILILLSGVAFGQPANTASLEAAIRHVIDTSGAKVGVAVAGLDFETGFTINDDRHYPMQSTFKFPLAIAVLDQADKGKFSLKQNVHISAASLDMHTWSPMVKDFPPGDIDLSLEQLLIYTVSKSDNNGCDALFHLVGGTGVTQQYIRSIGIGDIHIAAIEAEMKKAWSVQYTNWCRPSAMLQLLQLLYNKRVLSAAGNAFLLKIMTESENSPKRLKGLLPANTVVAHKTGTSDTNDQGITAATNDVGIVTLPGGHHYAIAVYVSDYKGGVNKGEHVIAEISKLVWNYLIQNKKG